MRYKPGSSYFLVMGLIGLLAVLIGFGKTFIAPMAMGTFAAPPAIHIHGAFAFAWISLFVIQTLLIRYSNFKLHKTLGFVGIAIALGAALSILPAGVYAVKRELALGFGDTAISTLLGTVTAAVMFLVLVLAGIYTRRNGATHKRLMLLATIALLWPAWFRFRHYFPSIPNPEIWFAVVLADSLIIVTWIWDFLANRKINTALLYTGMFIMAEHTFEVMMFDTPAWRVVAKQVYGFLESQ